MNKDDNAAVEELTPEVEENVPVVEPVTETVPETTKVEELTPAPTPELKEADLVVSQITTDPVQEPNNTPELKEADVVVSQITTDPVQAKEEVEEVPVVEEATPEVVEVPTEPTNPEPVVEPVPETVPETTPESTEEIVEEPVMIATFDEPIEETPVVEVPVEPVVEVPTVTPDLGQPEVNTEDNVPSFQTFPEEPTTVEETTPETTPEVVEVKEPEPVVEQATETITVQVPDSQPESYQASSQTEVVPTFQQMPEAPTTPEQTEGRTLDEEEPVTEEKPNTIRKIIPLIIVGLIIATIAGFIYVSMKNVPTKSTDPETLIPLRSEDSNTNFLVIGNDTSKKDTIYTQLTGMTQEELKSCSNEKNRLEYSVQRKEIEINGIKYNAVYPCSLDHTINYMIDSEGDNTVDGAVLVINADAEGETQARYLMEALRKTGAEKLVVYVVGTKNLENLNKELRDIISETGFENNTPVLNQTVSNIDELKAKINQTITIKEVNDGPTAVQSHKVIKLYAHFLSKEEGGMENPLSGNVVLNLEIGNEFNTVKLNISKDSSAINPGDNAEIEVELDRQLPLELGLRVPIYNKDSKVIGVGVISELN